MSLQSRLADLITAIGADEKKNHGVVTVASTATLTASGLARQFNVTGQTQAIVMSSAIPTALTDGQSLLIRLKDSGTARAITWQPIYRAVGVTLPTTTVVGKTMYVGAKWNAADSKWDVLAVGQEA